MRLHLPSLRAVVILAVNTAARAAEAVLDRADAVVCGWANATDDTPIADAIADRLDALGREER